MHRPHLVLAGLLAASLALVAVASADEGTSITPRAAPNPVVVMKIKGMGTVEIELFPKAAPKTVKNFIGLAEGTRAWTDPKTRQQVKRPFFDGLTFHRVIPDFMLQGGDPLGNGMGGPGFAFEDEINAKGLGLDKLKVLQNGRPHHWLMLRGQADWQKKVLIPLLQDMQIDVRDLEAQKKRQDDIRARIEKLTLMEAYELLGYKYNAKLKAYPMKRGYIAMANSGPNTNGSQFFLNVKDSLYLNGKHTVFGKIIKGLDVVDKIAKVKTSGNPDNRPLVPVVIESVRRK